MQLSSKQTVIPRPHKFKQRTKSRPQQNIRHPQNATASKFNTTQKLPWNVLILSPIPQKPCNPVNSTQQTVVKGHSIQLNKGMQSHFQRHHSKPPKCCKPLFP